MSIEAAPATCAQTPDEQRDQYRSEVLAGLTATPKNLPCKHLYDRRGSQLFDQICELPEYYPTRTELAIIEEEADEIATAIGPGAGLVEYGSGSSTKTRLLLDALIDPTAYIPVDISSTHLENAANQVAAAFPMIDVAPVVADFTQPFALPELPRAPSHYAAYFPGSTIGNFVPSEAHRLLDQIACLVGVGGGLVIGVDLQKDPAILEAAYNDSAGVTAAFNKNLLVRINRELDADLDIAAFKHRAIYDEATGRINIALVSQADQTAKIGNKEITFAQGEAIHTEYSHKYTIEGFAQLAAKAGFALRKAWTDPRDWFAVLHLVVDV